MFLQMTRVLVITQSYTKEENREYFNSWGVTDNYNADNAICLTLGEDIEIK